MSHDATTNYEVVLDPATKAALGRMALSLARSAGDHIMAAHGAALSVDFKTPAVGAAANSNPVSRVDVEVETLLRSQLSAEYPDHAVIGEELPVAARSSPFAWVLDPVDGTTNYINGFPLFGASIGVMFHGRPVAGAIWCALTHALRPGVYHAADGERLQFEGSSLARRSRQSWRGLVAEPGRAPSYGALFDTRVLGCATLEFALVAAGILRVAYIPRPALWDVVAGLALLHAAGCRALAMRPSGWETMSDFDFSAGAAPLAKWSEPLLIGSEADLDQARHVAPR
jgi:myo-inositol-1(or 4)-monophosphatase